LDFVGLRNVLGGFFVLSTLIGMIVSFGIQLQDPHRKFSISVKRGGTGSIVPKYFQDVKIK
jgi:hypothetical protein